ncbi:hypothetical protein [Nostoc sp.]|uniref:hypothetical protein n=1 Tax=Nostoc sp. TaxID=1180 RepID=UPI002FFB536E
MSKIATVIQGMLATDSGSIIDVESNSPQWLEWLTSHNSFRYEPKSSLTGFTARVEKTGYWYGYRKIQGKLHKRYIGKIAELTIERLEEIAVQLEESPKTQVTEKLSVTTPKATASISDDIAQLWQAVSQLRQEMSALGKLKAR